VKCYYRYQEPSRILEKRVTREYVMWLGKVDLSRFGSQFDYELRKNRYNTGGAAGKKLIGVQSLFIYFLGNKVQFFTIHSVTKLGLI
jgi:hypothetical protein